MKKTAILFSIFAALLIFPRYAHQASSAGISGLDVALKTMPFVDSMSEPDRAVLSPQECYEQKCVFSSEGLELMRRWRVLAYYGLYNATNNNIYLDKIKGSMEKLLGECDFFEKECRYIGVQTEAAYQAVGDEIYLEYLKNLKPSYVITFSTPESIKETAFRTREAVLFYKYNFNGYLNPPIINKIISVLYKKLEERNDLIKIDDLGLKETACQIYLAEIELYKVLNDKDEGEIILGDVTAGEMKSGLLSAPKQFFDGFDFKTAFADPDVYRVNINDLEYCADAALGLYETSKEEKYKNQAKDILQGMINIYWDSEFSRKYVGDNSFLSQGCERNEDGITCYRNKKTLADNGYAAYLFSRLKDELFSVPDNIPVKYSENPQAELEFAKPEKPEKTDFKKFMFVLIAIAVVAFAAGAAVFILKKNKSNN